MNILLPFLQPKTLIIFRHLIKLSKTRILVFYTVPMILKKCAGTLAPSLSDVFNASLTSRMLPHNWKLAEITRLRKKGALSH